jgi:5'-nucleotidase
MKTTKTVYIDMDGVIANFEKTFNLIRAYAPDMEYPHSTPGFFKTLDPIEGAIDAVNTLRENPNLDVWILSAPSEMNAISYTEKREWIEKHFDIQFCRRLILSPDKSLFKGDYLIDDRLESNNQHLFEGEQLVFGSEKFPNWETILDFFKDVNDEMKSDNEVVALEDIEQVIVEPVLPPANPCMNSLPDDNPPPDWDPPVSPPNGSFNSTEIIPPGTKLDLEDLI